MSISEFPSAILVTVTVVGVIAIGRRLDRIERETGVAPKASDWLLYFCLALGGSIYWFQDDHPFIKNVYYDIAGVLIGLAFAFLIGGLLRFLRVLRNR